MTNSLLVSSSIANDKVIDSYGFAEQLSTNDIFFQELISIAAKACDCESAYISLVGTSKQYILSQHSAQLVVIPASDSICQLTIKHNELLEIHDTSLNPQTAELSIVKNDSIKFYVGVPLINIDGLTIGSFCITNSEPKHLTESQKDILNLLAKHAINTLDSQRTLIRLIKKINTNFKPAACSDINCLQGELQHLQNEVLEQKGILDTANINLTSFAHVVAHDIKSPIRTIHSFIQLLERKLNSELSVSNKSYFDLIKTASNNIINLIDDLLMFSESKIDTVQKSNVSFQELMKNVTINLKDSIQELGGKINYPKDEFIIYGHTSQLIQLFQNLISNGLKYQDGSKSPVVSVQCTETEIGTVFCIKDNGIGMDAEHLDVIFEPFKRLHTKHKYNGSGIGLSTCVNVLKNHKSVITVDSVKGSGTEFTFLLPNV